MTQTVHLFLEEDQIEELQKLQKLHGEGEIDLPPAIVQILETIDMWKEPA